MKDRKERKMPSMSTVSLAETVAEIEELLIQILLWLPALSLIRFKTVSKYWLFLISDPEFHRRHTLRNPNPKVSAFFSSDIQGKWFKTIPLSCPSGNPFKTLASSVCSDESWLRIIQSCNGLFLCYSEECRKRVVYVVNPTTNKFLALSSPSVEKDQGKYQFVRYGLAFDPSKSPYYKVFCISSLRFTYVDRFRYHHIDIYSSETGAWEKHLEVEVTRAMGLCGFNFPGLQDSAVYCNGAIHWIRETYDAQLSFTLTTKEWKRSQWDVVHYFDINEECLRMTAVAPPVPTCLKNSDIPLDKRGIEVPFACCRMTQRCFGESNGRIYLVETYENIYSQVLDVMEMEMDYSGWTVKYHVDLDQVIGLASGREKIKNFLGFFRNEQRDEENSSTDLWLLIPGNKVVSYNLRRNTFKTVVDLANKDPFPFWHGNYYAYTECLASV